MTTPKRCDHCAALNEEIARLRAAILYLAEGIITTSRDASCGGCRCILRVNGPACGIAATQSRDLRFDDRTVYGEITVSQQ